MSIPFPNIAQDLVRTPNPYSTNSKEKVFFVTWNPLVVGSSINTDNNYRFDFIGTRLGVNWTTEKQRKFAWFGQIGTGGAIGSKSLNFYESGFLIGKIIKGKRSGFFDLNIGLAAIGRKAKDPLFTLGWGPGPPSLEEVREVHTVGIPIDLSVNTSRGALGIGIGVTGNLNLNQLYGALNVRVRFGKLIK